MDKNLVKRVPSTLKPRGPIAHGVLLSQWEKHDANYSHWEEVWRRKQFRSWREWRMAQMVQFRLSSASWMLFDIPDPKAVIPGFTAGPFNSWAKEWYGDRDRVTFTELAVLRDTEPKEAAEGIELVPKTSIIIGVLQPDDTIVIVEGMHRCLYVAWAARFGLDFPKQLTLALAVSDTMLPTRAESLTREVAIARGYIKE